MVPLPARVHRGLGQRRDRRDPDVEQAAARSRADLKRDGADAIRAFVMHHPSSLLVPPGGLHDLLADQTIVRAERRDGAIVERTRGDERYSWLQRQASSLDACQEVRAFCEAQCGTYTVQPHSCRSRICPDCERERAAEAVRKIKAIVDTIDPRRRAFMVLTVRNAPELIAGLDHLDRSFASLRRRALFRGGACKMRQRDGTPMHPCAHPAHPRSRAKARDGSPNVGGRNCPVYRHRPIVGGVRLTEVTFNVDERTWHPHMNVLADAPFIPQAELADTWRACTCSDRTHRRRGWCPPSCALGSSVVWIGQVDADTVREAVKYVTKATDLVEGDDPLQICEFLLATRGRRLVQGFGSFFGLHFEDPEDTEETVTVSVDSGQHDREGREIFHRFRLPRYCRACGRDTKIDEQRNTYEPPVWVQRVDVRLRNGAPSWRPDGRGG